MDNFGNFSDNDMRYMRAMLAVLVVSIIAAVAYLCCTGNNPVRLLIFPGDPNVIRTAKRIVATGFMVIAFIGGLHRPQGKTDFRGVLLMLLTGFGFILTGYSPGGHISHNPDRTFLYLFLMLTVTGFLLGWVVRWGWEGRNSSPNP